MKPSTKLRFAVTGASGFLGRHVVQYCLNNNLECVVSARNSLDQDSRCRFVALDIAHPPPDAFEQLGCPDVLIHLAWNGLPNYHLRQHFERELLHQYRFLQCLIDAGLPKLVVAGTCFEYGLHSGALSEQMPTNPCTAYGLAKDTLRRQLTFLTANTTTTLIWARLFYLWGAGQAASSLYSQLLAAAQRGESVFKMSGGEQLRDYLPVTEAARYLVNLAIHPCAFDLVNLCSGHPIAVRSLVEHWITTHGLAISPQLGCYPYPDYEPLAFWGDASRLQQIFSV